MFIGICDWKDLDRKKGTKTPIIIDASNNAVASVDGTANCMVTMTGWVY